MLHICRHEVMYDRCYQSNCRFVYSQCLDFCLEGISDFHLFVCTFGRDFETQFTACSIKTFEQYTSSPSFLTVYKLVYSFNSYKTKRKEELYCLHNFQSDFFFYLPVYELWKALSIANQNSQTLGGICNTVACPFNKQSLVVHWYVDILYHPWSEQAFM